MAKRTVRCIALVTALAAVLATGARADDPKPPPAGPTLPEFSTAQPLRPASTFYLNYLAPRLDARLNGQYARALDFTNPNANPWTRDPDSVQQMERSAIRATKSAFKRYTVEHLGLDNWSVPLRGGKGSGLDAMRTDSGGTRLRFGFASRRPKAEVLVPVTNGRVALSVNGRGAVGASFETRNYKFRVNATIEPLEHEITFGLVQRF